MGWMCRRIWGSLSIGPRISTYWWCAGHSGRVVTGCLESDLVVVGDGPTWLVGGWLLGRLVDEVHDHHVVVVVALDVVEMLTEE